MAQTHKASEKQITKTTKHPIPVTTTAMTIVWWFNIDILFNPTNINKTLSAFENFNLSRVFFFYLFWWYFFCIWIHKNEMKWIAGLGECSSVSLAKRNPDNKEIFFMVMFVRKIMNINKWNCYLTIFIHSYLLNQ